MRYKILIHSRVAKTIGDLPKAQKVRLSEFIDTLKDNPVPFKKFDIKKLKGQENRYRARLGDFRLTYEVDKKERLIMLLKIEKREKAYKK